MTEGSVRRGRCADLEDLEQYVSNIWRTVFRGSGGGLDDDFFELSGTSVDAAVIAAKLSVFIGMRISPGEIFAHSTPRALASSTWGLIQPADSAD